MSQTFRELLKTIGSGVHTGKNLSREEAAEATRQMLLKEATPAQIGAFLIAHRIKRPSPEELAGMLDIYDQLGPRLEIDHLPFEKPVVIFGNPYDGRSRTVSVSPITTLMLVASGVPVVLHGGDIMPTKYGLPLVTLWQGLGIDFTKLNLKEAQQFLEKTGLTFIYLPTHFPLAYDLVPYRDQIGKRPPIATMELMWLPCKGNIHPISGYVHPPTEERFLKTFAMKGVSYFTSIKGLEGSCDLACNRTAIIGFGQSGESPFFERFLLDPRDYGFSPVDVHLESTEQAIALIQGLIQGQDNELKDAAILNGGFYLWRCGYAEDLKAGFEQAEVMLKEGKIAEKLKEMTSL